MLDVAESSGLTQGDIEGIQSTDEIYERNLTTLFHVDFISDSFDDYKYWEEDFDFEAFKIKFLEKF